MKYAVTIGFPRKGEPEIIAGPEVLIAEQKTAFKELLGNRVNEKFERVEIVDSARGRIRKAKFLTGAELKARDKARAEQEKAHREAQAAAKAGKQEAAKQHAAPASKPAAKAPAKPAAKGVKPVKEELNKA